MLLLNLFSRFYKDFVSFLLTVLAYKGNCSTSRALPNHILNGTLIISFARVLLEVEYRESPIEMDFVFNARRDAGTIFSPRHTWPWVSVRFTINVHCRTTNRYLFLWSCHVPWFICNVLKYFESKHLIPNSSSWELRLCSEDKHLHQSPADNTMVFQLYKTLCGS